MQPLVKLVELRSYNDEPIVSATISSNGKWLIYSTDMEVRVFSIDLYDNDTAKLIRLKENLPKELTTCRKLVISNKNYLFHATASGSINVFKLTNDGDIEYRETIETAKCKSFYLLNLSFKYFIINFLVGFPFPIFQLSKIQ